MRIVSWNIQWGRGADGRVDFTRTIARLRELAADVICLQEVAQNLPGLPGGGEQDGPALLAAAFADMSCHYGPGVDVALGEGGRGRFGNLVLSRLPVLQVFAHLLPWPADAAVPSMQRACLEAVIEWEAGVLRVLTTHLEYYSEPQRLAQVRALRALQAEACALAADPAIQREANPAFAPRPRPAAALVCGDFNCEPGSRAYLEMIDPRGRGPAWQDAWTRVNGGTPHAPTVGLHGAQWPDRPYCCDYFFVSEELASCLQSLTVDAATPASDHQPIILELA